MSIRLTAVSSDVLVNWAPLLQPFAAWLHFDREWGPFEEAAVTNIIKNGCKVIMVTGESCEDIQDLIDWIVTDISTDLVLTFSAVHLNEQSAFDFAITSCPNSDCKFNLLTSFSDTIAEELNRITEMHRLILLAELDLPKR